MSEEVRQMIKDNRKLTREQALDALQEKYPKAKINKRSFSVAFYTTRKKILVPKRSHKKKADTVRLGTGINIGMLQTAAKFLREVGSVEKAIDVIKAVQTIQVSH